MNQTPIDVIFNKPQHEQETNMKALDNLKAALVNLTNANNQIHTHVTTATGPGTVYAAGIATAPKPVERNPDGSAKVETKYRNDDGTLKDGYSYTNGNYIWAGKDGAPEPTWTPPAAATPSAVPAGVPLTGTGYQSEPPQPYTGAGASEAQVQYAADKINAEANRVLALLVLAKAPVTIVAGDWPA